MAASMKMTTFWDLTSCSLAHVDIRFRSAYCLHYSPDDGDTTYFWNTGLFLRDYTVSHPWSLSVTFISDQ